MPACAGQEMGCSAALRRGQVTATLGEALGAALGGALGEALGAALGGGLLKVCCKTVAGRSWCLAPDGHC